MKNWNLSRDHWLEQRLRSLKEEREREEEESNKEDKFTIGTYVFQNCTKNVMVNMYSVQMF